MSALVLKMGAVQNLGPRFRGDERRMRDVKLNTLRGRQIALFSQGPVF
jgi:hypothetical protein